MRTMATMVAIGGAFLALAGTGAGLATVIRTPDNPSPDAQVEGYSPNSLATLTPGEYYLKHDAGATCTLTPQRDTPITDTTVTVTIPGGGLDQVCAETRTGTPHTDTLVINASGTITQLQGPVLLK